MTFTTDAMVGWHFEELLYYSLAVDASNDSLLRTRNTHFLMPNFSSLNNFSIVFSFLKCYVFKDFAIFPA